MLKTRVIPCLLLRGHGLVKTVRFKEPRYIGDPVNAVRIFNEKEVDEIVVLDIMASREGRGPPLDLISEIASECFMPMAYGGGIRTLAQVRQILSLGVEKVVINSEAATNPDLVREAAETVGNQSIIVSIDAKRRLLGGYEVVTHGGRRRTGRDPVEYASAMASLGAGEIFLNSVDRDGTMDGYNLELIGNVAGAVKIPVIACGGAGAIADFAIAVNGGGASAVAAGSLFVFHGRHRAVLISYPSITELEQTLG